MRARLMSAKALRLSLTLAIAALTFGSACQETPPPLNADQKRAKEFDNAKFEVSGSIPAPRYAGVALLTFQTGVANPERWIFVFSENHKAYSQVKQIREGDRVIAKFSQEDLDPTLKDPDMQFIKYLRLEKAQ